MSGALSPDLSLGQKQVVFFDTNRSERKDSHEYPRIYRRILHRRKQQLSTGRQTRMGRAVCESTDELYWLSQLLYSRMRRPPSTLSRSLFSGLLFQMLPRNQRLGEAANCLDKTDACWGLSCLVAGPGRRDLSSSSIDGKQGD